MLVVKVCRKSPQSGAALSISRFKIMDARHLAGHQFQAAINVPGDFSFDCLFRHVLLLGLALGLHCPRLRSAGARLHLR